MDPIMKAKKIQAMKSYKKRQFLYKLILHSLLALTCSLLCSYANWFPSINSFINHLFISLPSIWSFFFNPKCLFIVVNVIVVFLVGESKLVGSKTTSFSSPANQIYEEYVQRSRQLRGVPTIPEEKREEKEMETCLVHENPLSMQSKNILHESIKEIESKEEDQKEDEGNIVEFAKEVKEEKKMEEEVKEEEEEDNEENELPTEELNRRIEDFIARVNKQRWLESRSLVCCNA